MIFKVTGSTFICNLHYAKYFRIMGPRSSEKLFKLLFFMDRKYSHENEKDVIITYY